MARQKAKKLKLLEGLCETLFKLKLAKYDIIISAIFEAEWVWWA